MARLSLSAFVSTMVCGCVIEDPPSYQAPTRTPPRLSQHLAEPPIDQIYVTQLGATVNFAMPFASEDAGVAVQGYLLVDYTGANPFPFWTGAAIDPSTLDDTTRKFEFSAPVTTQFFGRKGCHRVTLRVSHADNFLLSFIPGLRDQSDIAEAYWWVNIIDPNTGDDGSVLANCPTASAAEEP